MRLLRPLSKAAAALLLGLVHARAFAGEAASPYELPLCPDDAAAVHRQERLNAPLNPNDAYRIELDQLVRADTKPRPDNSRSIKISGGATLSQGDRKLHAQDLECTDGDSGQHCEVSGEVEYRDPQLVVRGNTGSFDGQEAAFEGVQFELPMRPARGSASSFSVDETGVVKTTNVKYTTCPEGHADWLISADSLSIDTASSTGVAHDARVKFYGVTIMRLPVVSFPVGNARKSGFLFPSLGTSTRGGMQMSVPWYWNIAPQQDFTFTPTWFTSRGVDLEGNYRYLTRSSHGELLGNLMPNDSKTGKARSRWRVSNITDLWGAWRVTLDGENVSDARYFEDFAQGATDGASTAFLPRSAQLAWRDANFHAGVLVRNFQTLDQDLQQADRPATEAPRFFASGDWRLDGALPVTYGVDAEATRFRHPGEVQGWRFDAEPRVGLDFSGAGYFLRPSAMLDAAGYSLQDTAPGTDDRPTRTLPLFSVDTGLVFERESGSRGQRRITLEPRLMYLYAPYRNQDDLPLFDTGEPDLNWIELFRTNRYVGLDRVSDANQISVGVTTQVYHSKSGARVLSTTIGQTFNFQSPRVRLPGETPDSGNASDLIAQIELTAYRNWSVSTGLQWNPYADRIERADVRLQYKPAARSVLNVGYRFQNDRLEQTEASVAWPVSEHWRVYGRTLYSLRDKQSIEQFAGFEYSSCCWNLRMVGRDYVSRRTGARDRSIYLQLELKGLSNVGQAADAFLERAIRGYSTRERR
jgi:LPS-assembly protein